MLRVVEDFVDRQDFFHLYHVGDLFPYDGKEVSEERVEELKGKGRIVDEDAKPEEKKKAPKAPVKEEPVEDTLQEEAPEYTKEDIASMNFFKLKKLASGFGFDVENMKAPEMRSAVIEKLGL